MPLAMYVLAIVVIAIAGPMLIFWVTNLALEDDVHAVRMVLGCMIAVTLAGLALWCIPQ
jgi:threonine/homoserine/homoserine lactone efflux protein